MKLYKALPLFFILPLCMGCATNLSIEKTLELASSIKKEVSSRPIKNEHLLYKESTITIDNETSINKIHINFNDCLASSVTNYSNTSLKINEEFNQYTWIDKTNFILYSCKEVKDSKTYNKIIFDNALDVYNAWLNLIDISDGVAFRRNITIASMELIKTYIDESSDTNSENKIISSSSDLASLNFKLSKKFQNQETIVGLNVSNYLLNETNTTIKENGTIINEIKIKLSQNAKPKKVKLDKTWKEVKTNG